MPSVDLLIEDETTDLHVLSDLPVMIICKVNQKISITLCTFLFPN